MGRGGFYSRREIETIVSRARSPFLQLGAGAGRVFFVNGVDGVGADGRDGDDPDRPLLTLTEALRRCIDVRGDVIVVQDYWQPTGETWPILVNKRQVRIVGMANPNMQYPALHPPGNTAVFEVGAAGQYSEIAGFMIGGGAAHGGIESGSALQGAGNGLYVHDCWFGHYWFGTPLGGFLGIGTVALCGVRIENCVFFGNLADCGGAITGNAIDTTVINPFEECEFLRNRFFGCAVAINLADPDDCQILDNRFIVPDLGNGEAVTLGVAARGCMIDGNVAMNGGDNVLATVPYRDLSTGPPVGSQNHWGQNFAGAAVAALPVCA